MLTLLALLLCLSPVNRPLAEHHLAKGILAYKKGQYANALAHFERAGRLAPTTPSLAHWEGLTRVQLRQFKRAEKLLLKALGELDSPNAPFLKILGRVQLELGKPSWAMRSLSGAVEIAPQDMEARYYLAYTLVKLEEYDEAHKLLKALLKGKHPYTHRARLLLGIVSYRKKLLPLARRQLSLALGEPSQRSLTSKLLRVILIKELGLKTGFGGSLLVRAGFDSNPALNASPDMGTIAPKKGAFATSLAAWLFYSPIRQLSVETSLKRTFYTHPDSTTGEQVSSFNASSLDLGLFFRHHYLSRGRHRRLEGAYLFSLLGLDGGAGIPNEPSFFLFSERHSLLFLYNHAFNEKNSLELTFSPSYTVFRDENRDGPGAQLALKSAHFFFRNRFKLFPMVYLSGNGAEWDPWESYTGGLWLGLSTLGPKKTDLTASVGYQATLYPESGRDTSPIWGLDAGKNRLDHTFTLSLSLSKSIVKGRVRLGLSLSYMNQISNATFFDYDRLMALVTLSGQWDKTKEAQ